MSRIDLPHCWGLALENVEPILEQLNRRGAAALRIEADGVPVYSRLLIPDQAALDLEAAQYPARKTSQDAILEAVLLRLAARYPRAAGVKVALAWGGADGVQIKPLVTFGASRERAA